MNAASYKKEKLNAAREVIEAASYKEKLENEMRVRFHRRKRLQSEIMRHAIIMRKCICGKVDDKELMK